MVKIPHPWELDPIQYLITHKFPEIAAFESIPAHRRNGIKSSITAETLRAVEIFRTQLEEKPQEQIYLLIEDAKKQENEWLNAGDEEREREAFFNQPYAAANFEYWSKMSYWTMDEAIALSLGKDPKFVTLSKVQSYRGYSPFIAKYNANREQVTRAKTMGQLWDSTIPNIFITWAERMRFELPVELVNNVKSLGVQVADWKSAFETQSETIAAIKKQLDTANQTIVDDRSKQLLYLQKIGSDNETLSKSYSDVIAKKDSFISQLNNRIRDLEGQNSKNPKPQKPELTSRERESLLQLLIGMAIKGYVYDPNASRTNTAKEIANDLQLAGLSLDEDTIRKYLNEAKALFSDKLNRTE